MRIKTNGAASRTARTATETTDTLLKPVPEPVPNPVEVKEMLEAAAENGADALQAAAAKIPKDYQAHFEPVVRQLEANIRTRNTKIELTVKVDPVAYGDFCAGAAVHQCTVEEMVSRFLNSEAVAEWARSSYCLK